MYNVNGNRVDIIITDENFMPKRGTQLAAAYDLKVSIDTDAHFILPGCTHRFNSNVRIDQRKFILPDPFSIAALVIPRSGLGSSGLVISNLVGLIDPDYQGEVKVNLWNRTLDTPIQITNKMKVAQLLFVVTVQPELFVVDSFESETERGEGGHGSTGIH